MNTIPCVYVATMKGCDYGEKCRNAHYVNQLTNIHYCSGCTDVVVDVRHHYSNKKRGRVCLFKHEKETYSNYISRMNLLPGGPSKIQEKMQPLPKSVKEAVKEPVVYVPSKRTVPSTVSLEMFPMLTVALKKGRNVKIVVNSKVKEPEVLEVVEVPIAKVEELVIVKPTEPEPVVKKVEEPIKAEVVAPSKKNKKKEYKKRKWLEAKMAEEAKLAEEKRLAEEKAEKNRQKKERKRARQAEELAKGPEPPKPAPTPEVREPTEEELMKMIKRKMLKEKLENMKFYRVMLMHEHKPGNFKFMHVGSMKSDFKQRNNFK
jgi:hypothetical protein